MSTMTKEQIAQKMQQLKQLAEEMKKLKDELIEAGVWPLEDKGLEKAAGGHSSMSYTEYVEFMTGQVDRKKLSSQVSRWRIPSEV